jgi:hypothetical protein
MRIWVIEPEQMSFAARLKDLMGRMGGQTEDSPPTAPEERIRHERRLFPRIPCFLLVDFVMQGCAFRSFIKNISAQGAFIENARAVPAGPDVSLVISFPEHPSPVKIKGEVAWTGERGIGVRLIPTAETLLE